MNQPRINAAEGRANLARPLLRLLPVLVVAALVTAPAAAQAEPPALTGTSPVSPGTDLAPFVRGNSSGVIISAVPLAGPGGVRAGEGEGTTIELYKNKTCAGAPAKTGSAEELDGAGIQLPVDPETTTYISAQRIDPGGPSGCSNAIEYKHVKELPPPKEEPPGGGGSGDSSPPSPPHLRTVPGGWANDNTPLVTGNAPGAATVKIFTNPDCDGAPVAKGSVAQFEAGLKVEVVDNALIAFYGVSVGPGGAESRCSAPAYYVEDSLTPRTRITMGPASKTRKRTAVFRFTDTTGDAPGTTFFCKVDRRKWQRCSSPLHLRRLRLKRHVLRVKAIDPAGNAEPKGAKRRFKVVPRP